MADITNAEYGTTRHAVQLTPMQVPKASDVLADDLRERILSGDFRRAPRYLRNANWSRRHA